VRGKAQVPQLPILPLSGLYLPVLHLADTLAIF